MREGRPWLHRSALGRSCIQQRSESSEMSDWISIFLLVGGLASSMYSLVLVDDRASERVAELAYSYLWWVMRIWGSTTRSMRVSMLPGEVSLGIGNQADSFGGRSSVYGLCYRTSPGTEHPENLFSCLSMCPALPNCNFMTLQLAGSIPAAAGL